MIQEINPDVEIQNYDTSYSCIRSYRRNDSEQALVLLSCLLPRPHKERELKYNLRQSFAPVTHLLILQFIMSYLPISQRKKRRTTKEEGVWVLQINR